MRRNGSVPEERDFSVAAVNELKLLFFEQFSVDAEVVDDYWSERGRRVEPEPGFRRFFIAPGPVFMSARSPFVRATLICETVGYSTSSIAELTTENIMLFSKIEAETRLSDVLEVFPHFTASVSTQVRQDGLLVKISRVSMPFDFTPDPFRGNEE